MPFLPRLGRAFIVIASLLGMPGAFAASSQAQSPPQKEVETLGFDDTAYLHRWSKNGQNEFTPEGDEDLARWRDMITINVHAAVRNGDQLAALANSILSRYQERGKIVRTDSKPRTSQRPAEHLIVAILGNEGFLEAAFARVVLHEGTGVVAVYSHRAYGKEAAGSLGEWLKTKGASVEKTLMTWNQIPSLKVLSRLPQSP